MQQTSTLIRQDGDAPDLTCEAHNPTNTHKDSSANSQPEDTVTEVQQSTDSALRHHNTIAAVSSPSDYRSSTISDRVDAFLTLERPPLGRDTEQPSHTTSCTGNLGAKQNDTQYAVETTVPSLAHNKSPPAVRSSASYVAEASPVCQHQGDSATLDSGSMLENMNNHMPEPQNPYSSSMKEHGLTSISEHTASLSVDNPYELTNIGAHGTNAGSSNALQDSIDEARISAPTECTAKVSPPNYSDSPLRPFLLKMLNHILKQVTKRYCSDSTISRGIQVSPLPSNSYCRILHNKISGPELVRMISDEMYREVGVCGLQAFFNGPDDVRSIIDKLGLDKFGDAHPAVEHDIRCHADPVTTLAKQGERLDSHPTLSKASTSQSLNISPLESVLSKEEVVVKLLRVQEYITSASDQFFGSPLDDVASSTTASALPAQFSSAKDEPTDLSKGPSGFRTDVSMNGSKNNSLPLVESIRDRVSHGFQRKSAISTSIASHNNSKTFPPSVLQGIPKILQLIKERQIDVSIISRHPVLDYKSPSDRPHAERSSANTLNISDLQ